jgi:ubiquinone/menaquinone biosynthesis C-methylase UbiE
MPDDVRSIASAFDERASGYSKSDWHRHHAERLIELAALQPGQRVLDAGTGTGFAAIAAARRVGPTGRVVAVDVSAGMLDHARAAISESGAGNIELLQADATDLQQFASSVFDAVICSAALLYMPVYRALREWHRVLVPNGIVAFSSMRAGSPAAGRLFRKCVATRGVTLTDPSAELGSEDLSRAALAAAGFRHAMVIPGQVTLSVSDLERAWESNLRSAAHSAVRELSPADQEDLRMRYEVALRRARLEDEAAATRADVLYAFGVR